jgi:hypothetical protein
MQKKISKIDEAGPVSMEEVINASSTISKISGLSAQIDELKKTIIDIIENSPDNSLHSNELKKIF